jgi:D-aspartate ligase
MNNVAIAVKREPGANPGSGSAPPVLILNLFYSGLGIARQMSGRGVRVVGLSAHRRVYGNFTRLCQVRRVPNSQEQPNELAEYLLRAAPELRGAIIFPTRDADVLFLDRFRSELEPFYRLAIPPRRLLERVMDKSALVAIAEQAGVPVPRTAVVSREFELAGAAKEVGFPCVVKPVRSVDWRLGENWNLVGGRKAFRADNLRQLQEQYARISQVRAELMLQEWIPGSAEQIVVFGGYIREDSEPLSYFTARKIVQSPDDFGTGCVVASEPIPELYDLSRRLCRALGYQGMAEIEYKRDTRDGRFKLIEINTRHWDWHQLADASGVNLTWTAYCHLSGQPVSPEHKPIARARWVAEDALLTHVGASVYSRQCRPHKLLRQISGRRIYGIFSWKDPLPLLRYSLGVFFPTLAKAAFNKIRRGVSQP